jgi:hypothetical protein
MKKLLNWFCGGVDPETLRLEVEAEAILRTLNDVVKQQPGQDSSGFNG